MWLMFYSVDNQDFSPIVEQVDEGNQHILSCWFKFHFRRVTDVTFVAVVLSSGENVYAIDNRLVRKLCVFHSCGSFFFL